MYMIGFLAGFAICAFCIWVLRLTSRRILIMMVKSAQGEVALISTEKGSMNDLHQGLAEVDLKHALKQAKRWL